MKDRVPPTLDELVSAARKAGPSSSRLTRIADDTARRTPSSTCATQPSLFRTLTRPHVLVLASAAVVVSSFATTRVLGLGATAPSTAEVGVPTTETKVVTAPAVTDPALPPAEPATQPPEIPSIDVRALPTSKVAAEQQPRVGSESAKTAPTEELSEGALLQRAHAAMATDPNRSLALTAEHARRFPAAVLAQEREVIAVEALSRLGRKNDARERAAAFFAKYPGSAYRTRVDDALGSSPVNNPPAEGR
ncbi:hypothetical protein AKJ09_09105 [Labilithrix luteola]|uniref:Outer membrane lipoprotein BamD-like domain-containing protein n=1 Tax=Labilithrix luteola TaxID=1391654 RepID=A0A0K1Q9V0_9BACT|nr:hypothetical protein [Labilithrix luteola]AKV02442.1 hypothetical protein AKJ09_09105 [Labilithrix luteola]